MEKKNQCSNGSFPAAWPLGQQREEHGEIFKLSLMSDCQWAFQVPCQLARGGVGFFIHERLQMSSPGTSHLHIHGCGFQTEIHRRIVTSQRHATAFYAWIPTAFHAWIP